MTVPSHPTMRIFISHSSKDEVFTTKLTHDLRNVFGEEAVWYDVSGVKGGEFWWDKIIQELTNCSVFIVILSEDALKSRWVRHELDIALGKGKIILPVLFQNCEIRADLKTMEIISFLDRTKYETNLNKLVKKLNFLATSHFSNRISSSQCISRRTFVLGSLGLSAVTSSITWLLAFHPLLPLTTYIRFVLVARRREPPIGVLVVPTGR